MTTARSPGTIHDGDEARTLELTVERGDLHAEFLEHVATIRPDVVVDLIGSYSALPIDAPRSEIERLMWMNSVGKIRLLAAIIDMLREGAAVIHIESSLGTFASEFAPVLSAAKASESALWTILEEKCRKRSLHLASIVVTAAKESVSQAELERYRKVFGQGPPSANAIARVIEAMIPVARLSAVGARLWFPSVPRADPLTQYHDPDRSL